MGVQQLTCCRWTASLEPVLSGATWSVAKYGTLCLRGCLTATYGIIRSVSISEWSWELVNMSRFSDFCADALVQTATKPTFLYLESVTCTVYYMRGLRSWSLDFEIWNSMERRTQRWEGDILASDDQSFLVSGEFGICVLTGGFWMEGRGGEGQGNNAYICQTWTQLCWQLWADRLSSDLVSSVHCPTTVADWGFHICSGHWR